MIKHTYKVLEFDRLLDILSSYASSPVGRSECLSFKPWNDLVQIEKELTLVSEMRLLLKVKGFVSFSELADISGLLEKSRADGSWLEPQEILSIFYLAEACLRVKDFIRKNQNLCPGIQGLAVDIPNFEELIGAVKKAITPRGEIKDSASSALKRIRSQKVKIRGRLQRRLEDLSRSLGNKENGKGAPVTIRDGRYVVAVRSDQKLKVKGIVHDYSRSHSTCFLEPVEVISDNNRMAELADEEATEERKILMGLTDLVRERTEDLTSSQKIMGILDGLYARAGFSEAMSCVMPEIESEVGIKLKGARNPILQALSLSEGVEGKAVPSPVAVDISLERKRNILIISGPNRGGKTVTLKTLGLICLMTQTGIHIPAEEGSRLGVFQEIMADIGDEQDLYSGFSTFSAHASHLKQILEKADDRSLVIIDEPGVGTDPDEGAALSMAVLDLLSEKGTSTAVSTHMNRLKSYGILNERAVNASVEFDSEKRCPTFRLKYGAPGTSYGLEIAESIGLPFEILERAKGYLDKDEVRLKHLIDKLNRLMVEAEQEKQKAQEANKRYCDAEAEMRQSVDGLESEYASLIEAKRAEADSLIREARDEFRRTVNLFKKEGKPVQAQAGEIIARISDQLTKSLPLEDGNEPAPQENKIKVNQKVFHRKLKKSGIVKSVSSSGEKAVITVGNVRTTASLGDLELIEGAGDEDTYGGLGGITWDVGERPSGELNVIGYKVEDAIALIDRSIDRALVDGKPSLRIVHGFGTGRLKDAIRRHLNEVRSVRNFGSADPEIGGEAVTVVQLS